MGFYSGRKKRPVLFFLGKPRAWRQGLFLFLRRQVGNAVVCLLSFYQKYISVRLIPSCRYYPSCSDYFLESVKRHGLLKGVFKGGLRVLRCNPLFAGGYDPVK